MKQTENIQEELTRLSSFLTERKASQQQEGFQVPPLYFDILASELLEKVQEQPVAERRSELGWLQWLFRPRYTVGFSLATVALLLIAWFWFSPSTTATEISAESAVAYIKDNWKDFDSELLKDEVLEGEFYFSPDIEDETIEQYLEDNLNVEELEEML